MEISATQHAKLNPEELRAVERLFEGRGQCGFRLPLDGSPVVLGERMDGRTGDMHFSTFVNQDQVDFTVKMDGRIVQNGRVYEDAPMPKEILAHMTSGGAWPMPRHEVTESFEKNEQFSAGLRDHLKGVLDRRQLGDLIAKAENVTADFGESIDVSTGFQVTPDAVYNIHGTSFDLNLRFGGYDPDTETQELTIRSVLPPCEDSIENEQTDYAIEMLDWQIVAHRVSDADFQDPELRASYDQSGLEPPPGIPAVQVEPGVWRMMGLETGSAVRFEVFVPPDPEEAEQR